MLATLGVVSTTPGIVLPHALSIDIRPSVWWQGHRENLPGVQISRQISDSIPPNPETSEVLKGIEELAVMASDHMQR